MDTLAEAKEYLRNNWETGAKCPCCTQYVRLYKKRIYAPAAKWLIAFYRLSKNRPNEWIHIREILGPNPMATTGNGTCILHYWDLIEEKINLDTKKRCSGFWRITEQGRLFVENKILLPKHAKTFDGKRYGFSGPMLSIKDALGSHFDYEKLMRGEP